jgi:hypothetical protein
MIINENGVYKAVKKGVYNSDTGKYYTSLQEAIDETKEGETLILLNDFKLTEEDIRKTQDGKNVLISINKAITLDFNGHTISVDINTDETIDSVICVEDGASLRVIGNGGIDVNMEAASEILNIFHKNGIFTTYLIKAFSGHADKNQNGKITVKETFDYLYNEVSRESGGAQTPNVWGNFKKNLILMDNSHLDVEDIPEEVY